MEKTIKRAFKPEEIVCIIPTLNECATVAEVIDQARQFTDRIFVVDGHSEDETYEVAFKSGAEVLLQDGKGKGMALQTAFKKIHGEVYVIIDGDGTYDALEMENLLQPIFEDKADIVVGSRLRGKLEDGSITRVNKLGNGFFNLLINLCYNGAISDSQSGFRAMNRKAVETLSLSSKGFEIETEITVKALKKRLRILEVPITYRKRTGSRSKLNSVKDGSRILKNIFFT